MKNSRVLSKSLMKLFIQGILASYKPRTIKENRHKCDINIYIYIYIYIVFRFTSSYTDETDCCGFLR